MRSSVALVLFLIVSCRPNDTEISKIDVVNLSKHSQGKKFSIALDWVYPWCDHIPLHDPDRKRQHLIIDVIIKNHTDKIIDARLQKFFVSFDKNKLGKELSWNRLEIDDFDSTYIRPQGERLPYNSIPANKEIPFRFYGEGIFNEGSHDKKLYITLVFSVDEEKLIIRDQGSIRRAD